MKTDLASSSSSVQWDEEYQNFYYKTLGLAMTAFYSLENITKLL